MSIPRDVLSLVTMCAVVIVLSLAGLAAFLTGLVSSMDGLLLLLICLMMAGVFGGMLFQIAKEEGWLPARRRKQDSSAAAPANPSQKEGK